MNLEDAITKAIEILQWRIKSAPVLTKDVNETINVLKDKRMLTKRQRHLLGLSLFTYAMRHGPEVFESVNDAGVELGVVYEVEYFADSYHEFMGSDLVTKLKDLLRRFSKTPENAEKGKDAAQSNNG